MRGFTIIEMVLYASLLSILLFILVSMLTVILDVRLESEATSSVEQDGRFIIARLAFDIHRASSIIVPSAVGAQESFLQISIDGVNYTYGLAAGNMSITNNNGTDVLNSINTTIPSLTFTRIGNGAKDTIRANVALTSRTRRSGAGFEQRTFQTTLSLR